MDTGHKPLLDRLGSSVCPYGWTCFGAVGTAALIARFLAQLGELVTELGELLVLRGAEVAHTLLAVGSLTFGVHPCRVAFDEHARQMLAQRPSLLAHDVVGGAGLLRRP